MTAPKPPPVDWVALARVLDGTDDPAELTGETALEYERILTAGATEEPQPVTEAEAAADALHAEVNTYVEAVADDLEAKGIDPNSPESHEYFVAIEALRP